MPINRNELTKEMLAKAMQCKTADELTALANAAGGKDTCWAVDGCSWHM